MNPYKFAYKFVISVVFLFFAPIFLLFDYVWLNMIFLIVIGIPTIFEIVIHYGKVFKATGVVVGLMLIVAVLSSRFSSLLQDKLILLEIEFDSAFVWFFTYIYNLFILTYLAMNVEVHFKEDEEEQDPIEDKNKDSQ
jgi:hypothetical protein